MPVPILIPILAGAAGALGGWLFNKGAAIAKGVADAMPMYEESVTASVWGNARSTKKEMFRLALAICFGQVSKLPGVMVPFTVRSDYDMMGKSVSVELQYQYGGMLNRANVVNSLGRYRDVLLQSVEEDVVCGTYQDGGWFFNNLPFAEPPNTLAPLPVGTVGYGTVNGAEQNSRQPGPCGDGISRGSFLEKIFYSKLAAPCQVNQFYTDLIARQNSAIQITPAPNTTGGSGTSSGTTSATTGSLTTNPTNITSILLTTLGGTIAPPAPTSGAGTQVNTSQPTSATLALLGLVGNVQQ